MQARPNPADVTGPQLHSLAMGYATAVSLLEAERAEWAQERANYDKLIGEMRGQLTQRQAAPIVMEPAPPEATG